MFALYFKRLIVILSIIGFIALVIILLIGYKSGPKRQIITCGKIGDSQQSAQQQYCQ